MKVYFDVSTLNPKKITGVGVYMLELLRHFAGRTDIEVVPVLKISRFKKRREIQKILPQTMKIQLLWPWISTDRALYHGPDFKISTSATLPKIVTVHDMVVFEKKYNEAAFYEKGIAALTRVLSSNPAAVIANSEATKNEILKHFPGLEEKVQVTLLGSDQRQSEALSPVSEPYILYLGTLEKRKNVLGVIAAFEKLKAQGSFMHKLVLAGTWGYGQSEIEAALGASPFREDIVHLNYVPAEQLPALYKKASLFFFPTFYEGFGIPVLEAMGFGCPVVASDIPVLQEICGEAALLASPDNPQLAADLIKRVLQEPELQVKLSKAGRERSRQFTWARCADQTVELYKKVLR